MILKMKDINRIILIVITKCNHGGVDMNEVLKIIKLDNKKYQENIQIMIEVTNNYLNHNLIESTKCKNKGKAKNNKDINILKANMLNIINLNIINLNIMSLNNNLNI